MENRNVKKYLYDIKQAIDSINEYLGDNRDFFKYQENKQLRRAVERELEIIGEAVNKALLIKPELVSSIQDAPLTAENGITDNCSAVFVFSIPKNIPKLLRKQ